LYFENPESGKKGKKRAIMTTNETNTTSDRRRHDVIETRFRQHGKVAAYYLTINQQLWSCVEWSPSRRAWCVQDASGRCLAHCDAIHGEHIDSATAVQLAKKMIRDGRMPTPEDAAQQLQERLERDRLGEPWEPLQDTAEAKPVLVDRSVSK
jgi:hypothetical protein